MERYRVVAFETVFPIWADQVKSRGGGVAFVPLDQVDWQGVVNAIVRAHFLHATVRAAELGVSTLDEAALAQFCHAHQGSFWQGGDRP